MPKEKTINVSDTETKISSKDKNEQNIDTITQSLTNDEDIIEIGQLKGKEIWHYSMLEKFFMTCDIPIIQKMMDIINGNHLISLRFLDWFVTRYCYLYKTNININNKFTKQNNFNINISYKAQLKSFTKKYFDPFKRKKKFVFTLEKFNVSFLTTLGQLNFFRWAILNDIITCTETNYREIIAKYDHVNSFFKKHTSNSSTYSSNTSIQSATPSCGLTDKSTSQDNNSMINTIYKNSSNSVVVDNYSNKTIYKAPQVYRNICIEL